MPPNLKCGAALVALSCLVHPLMARNAFAITAEVAKKCGVLADIAYPLRVPGNPAAGRTNGTSLDVQNYFNKCVANGGNMGGQSPKQGNHEDSGAPKEAR